MERGLVRSGMARQGMVTPLPLLRPLERVVPAKVEVGGRQRHHPQPPSGSPALFSGVLGSFVHLTSLYNINK